MKAEPQAEHEWLQQLVGEWTYASECDMGPGKPATRFEGTESVRSVGALWIIGEGKCEMPDGDTGTMIITIGFDPAKKQFVGTWIGSMMTLLWVYEGALDATRKVLTLEAEGPDFSSAGRRTKYQDIIEINGPNAHTFSSRMLGEDGTWRTIMTARYRRRK